MFIAHNKVRMHDTDMAGILYFPRQFRFVHDALEELVEKEGLSFHEMFHHNPFVFVIVHCEANYLAPVLVGDALTIDVAVESFGKSSFVMDYQIIRDRDKKLVGTAQTVHVTLDRKTRQKIPLPPVVKDKFSKYLKK